MIKSMLVVSFILAKLKLILMLFFNFSADYSIFFIEMRNLGMYFSQKKSINDRFFLLEILLKSHNSMYFYHVYTHI